MRRIIKRIGVGLIALALIGMSSFGVGADVFADSYNPDDDLIDVAGEPEGTELVVSNATGTYYMSHGVTDYGDGILLVFGKNDIWPKIKDLGLDPAEWPEDPDESKSLAEIYDDFGYYWTSNELIDFHLVDLDTGEEVENLDGNVVTITIDIDRWYDLSSNGDDSPYDSLVKYSNRKWEKGFMHLSDDGNSREFIPVTQDADGNWVLKVSDFSVFLPVLRAVEDDELPKTVDHVILYTGVVCIGVFSLLSVFYCARLSSKR